MSLILGGTTRQRRVSGQFAGEPWTAGAGLTHLRARHYDPALGRFLTRDSFPGFLTVPQTPHPYANVGNTRSI